MARPNVFTIPFGVPFLPTLADALLSGRFGALDAEEPLALADATILLPTRRAARSLRDILVRRSGRRSAVLPRIRPIGDVDEEDHILAGSDGRAADAITLPPSISRLDRLLTLATMILAWGRATRAARASDGEQDLIPASAADALRLAGDLARLIDDMQTAGVDWRALDRLAPDEHAGYWQLTLEFLAIAGAEWPRFLAEQGFADPVERRDRLIRAEAERLRAAPPRGPIIAAGSTGSIPATAELLKSIARIDSGAVVLPGLDQSLDDAAWEAIGDPADPESGAPSHPQYGLKRLIAAIGILRSDVEPLAIAAARGDARAVTVSRAMRPAETTDSWADAPTLDEEALDGLAVIEAANEQDEALAIATALRETLDEPEATAALVTPDRSLAQRVAVELRRWRIEVDDSAGQPLDQSPNGTFVTLAAEAVFSRDVVSLLALAKHPFARFGQSRARCRRAAKALELAALRGPGATGDLADLPERLANIRFAMEMRAERIAPRARRRLGKHDWGAAEKLAKRIADALGPLQDLADSRTVSVGEATERLIQALTMIAGEGETERSTLWSGRVGEALGALLAGLASSERLAVPPRELPGFLTAAMANIVVAPEPAGDPRIHIWGALEARLQTVDLMILGGLDEGVWPGQIRSDPWLSRRMRAEIGLPPPERRIGLAAHDFAEGLGSERVILSRAKRRGGSPTVPSRWVQRLKASTGTERWQILGARGDRLTELARRLDRVEPADIRPARRPNPTPPLEARPAQLSVTAIENLIRDPYAIYARYVLGLDALDPIGQRADPRVRGILIHETFAAFTERWSGPFDQTARERFLAIWRDHFREIAAYPEVHAVWLLKAEPIADWMIDWERGRDADVAARHAEIPGELTLQIAGEPFKLTARADRIDEMADGRIAIYDYKTGVLATPKQVLIFQPQLALEGAIAQAGGFRSELADRSLAELAWIGLGRIGKGDILHSAVDTDRTPDGVASEALSRLRMLITAYRDPAQGYISQARPMFERRIPGDYDHLARVAEWRYAVGGET